MCPQFVRCIVNTDKMSYAQLRNLAEEMKIHNWSRLRKAELCEALHELSVQSKLFELEAQH